MSAAFPRGYVLNRTRQVYLATQLHVAQTHWSRFRGLMWTEAGSFVAGQGLWIVPSRGVHTFAMRFPIDVIYLDGGNTVIYAEENLKPWRVAPVRMSAASVLELPGSTLSATRTAVGDAIEIALQEAGRA
jgi:uncharacterized membrane protein (UPF0127 family)